LKVADRFHYEVQSGPFKGMKYTRSAVLSRQAIPSLIGQYERQIYPALLAAAEEADVIIDVGHAEGYYAVGLARMGKRVVAFDADWHERRLCRAMAAANGVADRITVRSWCSGKALRELTQGRRALIFSDIDGGELYLFTDDVIDSIRHCALIVEVHGVSSEENEKFVRRFRASHEVEVLDHPSNPGGVELLSFLGEDALRMATEYRPFQQWIVARPRMHAAVANEATNVSAGIR
jgi:predicted O-methyltransferase YrrM